MNAFGQKRLPCWRPGVSRKQALNSRHNRLSVLMALLLDFTPSSPPILRDCEQSLQIDSYAPNGWTQEKDIATLSSGHSGGRLGLKQ
jgi:hypothetical protein